jgi:hypothetical protein
MRASSCFGGQFWRYVLRFIFYQLPSQRAHRSPGLRRLMCQRLMATGHYTR